MGLDWKQTRVVVTGGGGFLGSHVCDVLRERGATPLVPRTADGWDFRQPESARRYFSEARPEVVIDCAARQGGLAYQRLYPAEIFHDNMLLGLHTLHAAHLAGARRFISPVAACSYPGYVDGMQDEDDYWSGPLHESVLNYGFTRKARVVQGACYRRQYGLEAIPLLVTNLYGPREHFHPERSHALAALLRRFVEARRTGADRVVVWGTGRPVREWLYVRDAAEALVLAAEHSDFSEPLNVSTGGGLTVAELARVIAEVVGYEGEIAFDPTLPDGAMMKAFSNERIREVLGWTPRTELRTGIAATLAWLEANWDAATA